MLSAEFIPARRGQPVPMVPTTLENSIKARACVRYAPEFRHPLVDAFELRSLADYNPSSVARAKVRPLLAQTEALVRAIAEGAS